MPRVALRPAGAHDRDFAVNTRAQAVYRRLGFREVATAGPKLEMRWQP